MMKEKHSFKLKWLQACLHNLSILLMSATQKLTLSYIVILCWDYLIVANVCSSVKSMNIFFAYWLMSPRNILF